MADEGDESRRGLLPSVELLERSLVPMESWVRQWSRLRQSLTETLGSAAKEPDAPSD